MSIFSSFQHSQKGLLTFLDLDWARSIVQLNVKRWTLWTRRRGASPVYRRRVSSLPRFVDPANLGWCCVIGASEEMMTRRTVVMEITPNCLVEWPFYPVLLFLIFIISLCEQMEQFGCVWSTSVGHPHFEANRCILLGFIFIWLRISYNILYFILRSFTWNDLTFFCTIITNVYSLIPYAKPTMSKSVTFEQVQSVKEHWAWPYRWKMNHLFIPDFIP